MTKTQLAYAAGLIDGEGSILLSRHHRERFRAPGITVPNCAKELLDFLQGSFGGAISSKKKTKRHHTPSYHWSVYFDRAMRIMTQLLPYIQHAKKRRRIVHILSHYKDVTRRNGRYTATQRRNKQKFEADFFKL